MWKYIWMVTGLIGTYVTLQVLVAATAFKEVDFLNYTVPLAAFVLAFSLTWRDVVDRALGQKWSQAASEIGIILTFLTVVFLAVAGILQIDLWAFGGIMVAIFLAGGINGWAFSKAKIAYEYPKVLIANALAMTFAGFAFGVISFWIPNGTGEFSQLFYIMLAFIATGLIVAIISAPLIYVAKFPETGTSMPTSYQEGLDDFVPTTVSDGEEL